MPDPVQHLLDEHVDIMRQLAPLRTAMADLVIHGDAALERARPALDAVGRMMATQLLTHARKEDDALFPAVEEVLGAGAGPTSVMREEHREIHAEAARFHATLRELNEVEHPAIVAGGATLRRLTADGAGAAELARTAAEILRLLDQHFEKEEQVLFPMCRELLDAPMLQRVGRQIDAIAAAAGR
jgi:iron-sulfur cluster repair protein YtfE (RIC family)